MKQITRYNVFETNSSSYHTLTIRNISEAQPRKEIIKGQDIEIDPVIKVEHIGWTSCYSYIAKSSYERAQMVLRFIGPEVEDQLDEMIPENMEDYNDIKKYKKEHVYDTYIIQGYIKAIKQYIGDEFNVTIKLGDNSFELWDYVTDEGKDFYDLFKVKDTTDIDKLAETFYNIIFDNNIEIVEECESNE